VIEAEAMFTQLRIQNFKAWKDTGNIRLAPLTVFFGPNSSGKTSLLQFLLMLKQTAQSPDPKVVLDFGGDGRSYVDLGVWPEMVFAHDARRSLGFELKWRVLEVPQVDKPERKATVIRFQAEVGVPAEDSPLITRKFRYEFDLWQGRNIFSLGIDRGPNEEYEFWHRDTRGHIASARRPGMEEKALSAPVHFYGFPLETSTYYSGTGFTDQAELNIVQQLGAIRYLGPLRQMPRRLYAWAGASPVDVGIYGDQVVDALLSDRDRMLQPADSSEAIRFEELIERWLRRLGLLEAFAAKRIAPHRKEYELRVVTPDSREVVSLVDVGFGVSQFLPVLVQLFYAKEDSVLIFEQPEIHLHPRVQSELADLFIEALLMREKGWPKNVQILVESHSEHFLRRLQRRIAEGVLTPDQTALYFCKPGPDGSTIEELKLDEYGNISNWPENFFGDEVGDLAAMTEAAMKRQLGSEGE